MSVSDIVHNTPQAAQGLKATPLLELRHISYAVRTHRFSFPLLSLLPLSAKSVKDAKDTKSAKFREILHDVSLRLDSGESLGIMGRSGSGKSTLARVCAGMTHRGDILSGARRFVGEEVRLESLAEQRAFYAQAQILLQDSLSSLNPRLSVFENLCEGLIYLKGVRDKKQQLECLLPLLGALELKESLLAQGSSTLSGGEAQRVCLARALVLAPRLLILDESLSGLDYELCMQVVEFLKAYQSKSGMAVMMIGHDKRVVEALCGENIRVMSAGRLL